jgi:hypothetical protein
MPEYNLSAQHRECCGSKVSQTTYAFCLRVLVRIHVYVYVLALMHVCALVDVLLHVHVHALVDAMQKRRVVYMQSAAYMSFSRLMLAGPTVHTILVFRSALNCTLASMRI